MAYVFREYRSNGRPWCIAYRGLDGRFRLEMNMAGSHGPIDPAAHDDFISQDFTFDDAAGADHADVGLDHAAHLAFDVDLAAGVQRALDGRIFPDESRLGGAPLVVVHGRFLLAEEHSPSILSCA